MKNFEECRRLYWFQAYGGWNGWKAQAPARTREVYVLSKIKSRWMWAGEVVHGAVAEILQAYRAGAEAPTIDLRNRMREQFKSSRDRVYRQPKMAKTCALFEHEYEIQVDDWPAVAEHAEHCLAAFQKSPLHNELKALPPEDWLGIEDLDSFPLDGTKIHVKLDVAHRSKDGVRIIDWKTGRSEDETDPFQLAIYALYAIHAWGAGPDDVTVLESNLATGNVFERPVLPDEIARTRSLMIESIQAMQKLLRSSPEENIAVEPDYPVAAHVKSCKRCNFQKVCEDRPRV